MKKGTGVNFANAGNLGDVSLKMTPVPFFSQDNHP